MTELLPMALSDEQRRAVWLAQYRLANSRLREPEPDSACVALAEERTASAGQRESDLAAWAALRETMLPGVAAFVQAAQVQVREACAKRVELRAANYHAEHGMYDPTTGVTEYPGNGDEWMEEWAEIAEQLRAVPLPAICAADEMAS